MTILTIDAMLQIIKNTVRTVFPECQIILFGSRARQDFSEESDYDILVLIPDELKPIEKIPYRSKIRKMLLQYGIFSDILVQSYHDADVKKEIPGHIIRNALMEGSRL